MARMLTQVPLPLLPGDAAEIAPGVGVVACQDGGGVVWVHGLATFAWDAGDETARRLAAVQLVQLKAATKVQVAQAFGVIPVSVWRWARALAAGGVAGLVPAAKGPRRASKLTPQVIGRIRELDGQGAGKAAIAAAAGVSESSVRSVLRPAAGGADGVPAGQDPADTDSADIADLAGTDTGMGAAEPEPDALAVLPDPVPRDGERALARFGLLGEGAAPAFTPGARYPLAGLLLALPPLAQSGLLDCARQVYGRGFIIEPAQPVRKSSLVTEASHFPPNKVVHGRQALAHVAATSQALLARVLVVAAASGAGSSAFENTAAAFIGMDLDGCVNAETPS